MTQGERDPTPWYEQRLPPKRTQVIIMCTFNDASAMDSYWVVHHQTKLRKGVIYSFNSEVIFKMASALARGISPPLPCWCRLNNYCRVNAEKQWWY